MHILKLTLGDTSGDGHKVTQVIHFRSSIPVEQVVAAYKTSCSTVGIQLDDNNYGISNTICIAVDYEDTRVSAEAIRRLTEHGIPLHTWCSYIPQKYKEGDSISAIYTDSYINLFVKLVKLSLSDNVVFEQVKDPVPEIADLCGNSYFGYGFFS